MDPLLPSAVRALLLEARGDGGDAAMPQDQAYLDWNKIYDLGVKKNFKCQKSVLQKIHGGGGVT